MAFNVNTFRAKLLKDGARPSLFEVVLTAPSFVGFPAEQFSFMCKAAQLPTSAIGVIEVPYFGRRIKVAGDRAYEDWTVSVINDETFDLRNKFEFWQSAINSHTTKINAQRSSGATASPASYVGKAVINQKGKEGNTIKTVNLINVFPVVVGPLDLSWEAIDQIQEFSVTFAYDYFETSDGATV